MDKMSGKGGMEKKKEKNKPFNPIINPRKRRDIRKPRNAADGARPQVQGGRLGCLALNSGNGVGLGDEALGCGAEGIGVCGGGGVVGVVL
jgi:hypothetical protein